MTVGQATNLIKMLRHIVFVIAALCCLNSAVTARFDGSTPAGTVISNTASATYEDVEGTAYETISRTVTVTVIGVPAIRVTPDETSPSDATAPNETITRLFQICNSGNTADTFLAVAGTVSTPSTLQQAYFDNDNSGNVTAGDMPVTFGTTSTPNLNPAACIGVLFVVDTNGVTVGSQITLTLSARSNTQTPGTTNFPQDTGTIINRVGGGVIFTSPTNPNLPPSKLVENLPRTVAVPGQTLNYSIAFRNSGAVIARQVRVVDNLPAQLEYIAGTLTLNNRSLTDVADSDEGSANARGFQILIPTIAPDAVTEIRFQARLIGTNGGNGVVNTADLTAANAPNARTSDAVAVIDPVGTVYAGNTGGSVRIAGAEVKIAVDDNGTPLVLDADAGFAPNVANVNPFNSDGNGNFSFFLNNTQTGSTGSPVRYIVTSNAVGYRPRTIEVVLERNATGDLYRASIRALDGQPVAVAGGFALTSTTVEIADLAAMVFNIPMFEFSSLEISKVADKQTAEIGDIVTYSVQVRNPASYTMTNVSVSDILPPHFDYVEGTAQIANGIVRTPIEPVRDGSRLTFDLGDLAAGANVTITYRVRIGASAPEGEQYNTATVTGRQPNGTMVTTQPAKAAVRVKSGIFSMRQIIIGRVFEDKNLNGQFDAGERPVAGARIILNNGQSVITDSAGLYNIPAVSEGSLVLSLDPLTMPDGYYLTDDKKRRSSKSWSRLLQTPLGGGMLLRQNFAIAPSSASVRIADDRKTIDVNMQRAPRKKLSKGRLQVASLNPKLPLGDAKSADKTETYTVEATENVETVAAGSIVVLSPKMSEVIMTPALAVTARVAKGWTIDAELNGQKVSQSNIGETRIDNRNSVTTYAFVGLNIQPGVNTVRLTAVDENGMRGKTEELKVTGRGAAEKLEIVPAKNQLQAGGRESVAIELRAFDRWGNPAADGQVAIETSAGHFVLEETETDPEKLATPETSRRTAITLENGVGVVYLAADGSAETAKLKALSGNTEATTDIRITPELRPQILVGIAEYSFGNSAPDIQTSGSDESSRGRMAFYFRGQVFGDKNLLTLSYDSQKPINRVLGRDRFGTFDPLDRAYPIFGDSSTRFEDAQSNSKLYARLDRGNSYAMFGDMDTDLQDLRLSGYSRKLTGVKVHVENANGDFVSVTGARPDTAFARDVFPGGGLSVVRLSHGDILQGSEVISLEVRDRRNPEIIIRREQFIRSVDYNIDSVTGEIFFLRPISAFDYQLNLIQIIAAYEYRGTGASNYVYTGRAFKNFSKLGLKIGSSYVNQRQGEIGAFQLGGIDAEKTLWNGGKLSFEAAMSNGRFASGVNVFDLDTGSYITDGDASRPHNGNAFRFGLEQPLPFFNSKLRAEFARASRGFYNPFGATTTPGSQRFELDLEMRPTLDRSFKFGFMDERNETSNVSNARSTFSAIWGERWNNKFRTTLGFDHRHLIDNLTDKTTDSNLVIAGVEFRPTEKIELSVKREQNLTEADPTYPNQTTFAASYLLSANAKLFFTQRLAASAITPISDVSGSGFASSGSRRETGFGIETKIGFLGSVNGRYQIENGISGSDNFAVIGLQNKWKLSDTIAIEAGAERGFLLKGTGKAFNSGTFGMSWTPVDGFRLAGRYEVRDRNGFGQLFSVGAAGKIGDNWTTLARMQVSKNRFLGREASTSSLTGAFAYRPLNSDKYAVLFSYNHRANEQSGGIINNIAQAATKDKLDTLSADGLYQLTRSTELYGRFALRFNANGNNTTAYASALTYVAQARLRQQLNSYLDVALETRLLSQPSSDTFRRSSGAELGFWALPDLRLAGGYNFSKTGFSRDANLANQFKSGYYFTVTSKLSNIFDLFGTAKKGLQQALKKDEE